MKRYRAVLGFLMLMNAPSLEAQETHQPEPRAVQTAPQEAAVGLEALKVPGSRNEARSARDSLVPVDIIQGENLQTYGIRDMDSLLSATVPSYNVNQRAGQLRIPLRRQM